MPCGIGKRRAVVNEDDAEAHIFSQRANLPTYVAAAEDVEHRFGQERLDKYFRGLSQLGARLQRTD